MKTTKLIRSSLSVAVLAIFALVGCEKLDHYSIDAPRDLQNEIDSIADAKASVDTGDTTYIDIATAVVGAEDYSSGWWTAFSDYFTIPPNQRLVLEFINHNGGSENNWNNWTVAVANMADRDAADYGEYFVLRSDAYGWGNDDFDLGLVSNNYPDTDGDEDIWNDFRATMDGAHVKLEIDHSVTGNAFLTATAVGTNGTELVMTYNQPVPATEDIVAFLIADASYFEMERAYLLPSEVTVIEDVEPVSIEVTGAPEIVEIGNEDFWGNATATVTYADGSSEVVDTADVSFSVIPDMNTTGEKTVILAYSKTKQGEYTDAVSTYYNLEVVNAVASLEVTTMPDETTYTFPGPAAPVFDPTGMIVTATYSDGTSGVIPNENLHFENPGADGSVEVLVSYIGSTSTVTTTVAVTNEVGGINQVGATDFSTAFWVEFSNEYNVGPNSTKTLKMDLYSSENNPYSSPVVILRKADLTEYAVVRMDNYGWGDGYDAATATNDWDMDVFTENLDGSSLEITVTNAGNGTANVRYDVTYANGETHFQLYEGIPVDSSDLNTAITLEESYVDITSVE